MGKSKKKRIYFDYNIYEDYAKGDIQIDLDELQKGYTVYQSVALIEEYYKAEKNCNEDNRKKLYSTQLTFERLNFDKRILIPGETRIVCERDTFEKRYSIIKKNDTQEYVAESAKYNYGLFKENVNEKRNNNPEMKNYSNLDWETIWSQKEIVEQLGKFDNFLKNYNNECQAQLMRVYGISAIKTINRLKKNNRFELKKNMFSNQSYPDFIHLQTVIEFLYEVLQKCGYNSDKKNTAVSGVYDTSHLIYATYCEFFVTNDVRLAKRAKAIYYYLGVDTKVLSFDEFTKANGTNME